jgi:hypothetical protein
MTIFLVDLSLKLCLLEIARPLCLVNLKWVNDRASLTIEEPKFIQEDWDVFCNLSEEKADDRSSTSDKQLTVLSESKVEVAGADLDAVTETPGGTVCILPSAEATLSSVDPFLYPAYIGRPRKCKYSYCRRRKIKCEGGYPCKECKKYSHQASCQPSTGESPPPTLRPKEYKTCDLCRSKIYGRRTTV